MDRIPIYARGGAVIPMWPQAPPSTAGHHPATIELHLFIPAGDAAHDSLLQEDDGLTTAALDGQRYRTAFHVTRRAGNVEVEATVDGHGYPEFARDAFELVVHGATPRAMSVNGNRFVPQGGRVVIPNSGEPFTVKFAV
jgi:alpha-glucosidase